MKLALLVTAVTVLALSPVAAPAAPAAAARDVVLHDAAGDTWTYSNSTTGYTQAAQPAADVLKSRITHGQDAVQIRLRFDDLKRVGDQWYWFEIHTAGKTSWFVVEAAEGHYRGIAYQVIDGEWVRVAGVSDHIDYAADRTTLRVTRRLLDDPPWVRVRVRFELGTGNGTYFTDNPMNAGPTAEFTRRLASAGGSSAR
jgi:hypothetical protein